MDPLSHALIGGLAAKTTGASKRRFWIMIGLGMLPDFDVVFNYLGPWAALLQHRGLMHSLLGVSLIAAALAFFLKNWDQGSFAERLGCYLLPLLGHLAGDFLTSFGVPLLAPFIWKNFSLDILGSLGLVPILVLGLGLSWLHLQNKNGWRSTTLVWGSLAGYLVLMGVGKTYAESFLPQGSVALPSLGNPFAWRAVRPDTNDHRYHAYEANLLKRKGAEVAAVPMPMPDRFVLASEQSELVKEFLKDNRWPVVRVTTHENATRVEWGALIFSTRGWVRGKVAVEVSPAGEILHQEKIFSFWDPE